MEKLFKVIVLFLFSLNLFAEESIDNEPRDRVDSVRKAIDSFGKLDEKEVSEVDRIKKMFRKGKASGQLKVMYASAPEVVEPYATAIGGILKYELAEYRGFNLGAAAYISYDIPFASGEGEKRSSELSSSEGKYMDMGEAYLNYKYENLNLRAGRQILDTPLADTDDIRMIQNTFEAYIATYVYDEFEFMAGNLQSWSGYDADLDENWSKTGSDGVNFGGMMYAGSFSFDAWYYNITGATNAAYFDLGFDYQFNQNTMLHLMAQYLHESELDNSGFEASIYGALVETVIYDIAFNIAVNKAEKHESKESFSGFGGGTLFTSMDTMILDNISFDREAFSYVAGVTYNYDAFCFLYAYGDFNGKADSNRVEAHIVEQNIGMGYNIDKEFVLGFLYAMQEDTLDHANDWNRAQVMLSYNFK